MPKKPKEDKEKREKAPQGPVKDISELPKDVQNKLKSIKAKLDKFQKAVVNKFDKYIVGISLLPPQKDPESGKVDKHKINTLVLVDDTDSKKMTKAELKEKISKIISEMAEGIDKNIVTQCLLLTELWQHCYDSKTEMLQMIAMGAPVYDTGMVSAIKIAEIHKTMVLKKFEKYIVSYVLAGSLVQGRATPESDIDVFVVIDDTDVKKMTRAELKDKLRAIIIGMGLEAGDITGIKNKLNIQVYILTDFWDSIKEANPVIFTFLRDGVPFFDRGIFMPWKHLLKMGKIKPSIEAIEMYMHSGEQMLERVKYKLREIGMEDTFYALLTPSQAALMLYGVAPPTPKETPELMREIFVKKEKMLEEKYVTILEKNISLRKALEHGTAKEVSGAEIDQILKDSEAYLKRIKKLFSDIEVMKEESDVLHIYESVVTIIRDVLRIEGIERASDKEIVDIFEKELIHQGKVPEKYLRILNELIKAKKDYDSKKLTKTEVANIKKSFKDMTKFLIEYMQRKRGKELERAKIRVKHGNRYGEVILTDKTAFIFHDLENPDREMSCAKLNPDGSLTEVRSCTVKDFEKALTETKAPPKANLNSKFFNSLNSIFGKDVEVVLGRQG